MFDRYDDIDNMSHEEKMIAHQVAHDNFYGTEEGYQRDAESFYNLGAGLGGCAKFLIPFVIIMFVVLSIFS